MCKCEEMRCSVDGQIGLSLDVASMHNGPDGARALLTHAWVHGRKMFDTDCAIRTYTASRLGVPCRAVGETVGTFQE